MTLIQFKSLPEEDKAAITWRGVFLAGRSTHQYNLLLYDVHGFYVEVLYHKATNAVHKFRAFQSPAFIDAYLPQIDISNAFAFFKGE